MKIGMMVFISRMKLNFFCKTWCLDMAKAENEMIRTCAKKSSNNNLKLLEQR